MDVFWRLLGLSLLATCRSQTSVCSTGDVRLAGSGSSFLEGRVELCLGGSWGTVCDDMWDQEEASVVCNQLGYSSRGAMEVRDSGFGRGTGTIFLDDLQCNGDEDSLINCVQMSDCNHDEDAGVICQTDEVIIIHEGQFISNNSIVALESLGDYNATFTNPLICVTNLPSCCDTNRSGNWFPPSGGSPVDSAPNSPDLYQNWEDNQSIELLRPSSVVSVVGGLYRCEVPDGDQVVQKLYVGVYTSLNEGAVSITGTSYDRSSLTFTCISTGGPATTVTWAQDGTPIAMDESQITYQQSQIITDTRTATYQNRLSIITKSDELSGVYTCIVQNSISTDSESISVTICLDRSVRFNDEGVTPRLEVCSEDTWISLESNFQSSIEESVISDLSGTALETSGIALRWEVQSAMQHTIISYDITCSSENLDTTLRASGGSEAATFIRLTPSTDYHCCIVANLDQSIFNLVMLTSTECVSVSLKEGVADRATASQNGLSTVTIALGVLVGLLILIIVVVAGSCVYVMLSKRRHQVTHPSSRRQHVTTSSEFLVDNPIYKTSTASLISSPENGLHSRDRTLRMVGSEGNCNASPRCSTSKFAANNPQYGTHLTPPPTQKPPRYIKVSTGTEPMYELIQVSESGTDRAIAQSSTLSIASGTIGGEEPVYSTPSKVKQRDSNVPLYESTMDIPATVGEDGEYAKLNHKK